MVLQGLKLILSVPFSRGAGWQNPGTKLKVHCLIKGHWEVSVHAGPCLEPGPGEQLGF